MIFCGLFLLPIFAIWAWVVLHKDYPSNEDEIHIELEQRSRKWYDRRHRWYD